MDEEVKMPGDEGRVPTGDVQLAINQAIIKLLDPAVNRSIADQQIDKIRKIKELEG